MATQTAKREHGAVDAERHTKRTRRPLLRFLEQKSDFSRCVYAKVTHVVGVCIYFALSPRDAQVAKLEPGFQVLRFVVRTRTRT